MMEHLMAYKPKNLAEDVILSAELRAKGSKTARKRLAKEKKGTYPETGTPADCSIWWMPYKNGKKKNKMAMVIMASHYTQVVKQLDRSQGKVLQLEATKKSQEETIKSLMQKLQQRDEENRQLYEKLSDNSRVVLRLGAKTRSQEKEIKLLELQLLQLKEKIMQLNQDMYEKSSEVLQLKSKTASQQKEISGLRQSVQEQKAEIEQLEDKIVHELNNKLACHKPAAMGMLLENLLKCASEALGPGTKLFDLYYHQETGASFEYFQKYRLYCSYSVYNSAPDRNDRLFLCIDIDEAAKSYQVLELQRPEGYTDLLSKVRLVDKMLTPAKHYECSNCDRRGHTKAQCRRPGGDSEVGTGHCYTCGEYGHWARKCWTYSIR